MHLDIRALLIPDIKLINSGRFKDARGYFSETFARSDFAAHGLPCDFIQDNQSSSDVSGTVRGLHFQNPPFAQTIELSDQSGEQLLVPAGFAHGFCTLAPHTIVFYKVDKIYSATHDSGINWIDPQLAIPWPISAKDATVSDKDRRLPMLAELSPVFA